MKDAFIPHGGSQLRLVLQALDLLAAGEEADIPQGEGVMAEAGAALRRLASVMRQLREADGRCQASDRALTQLKIQFAEMERSAAIGYFFWNIPAKTFELSEGLCRLYGIAPADFGRTYEAFLGFVHPEDVVHVREAIMEARHAGKGFDFHHRILRPDGRELALHAKGAAALDAAGNVQTMSGTEQDVTANRQLIADMRRYAQDLEKMNKLMVGRELKMIELNKALAAAKGGGDV